jgi:antitoxin MazE
VKTTIQRWGNSLAVRIPKVFAEETYMDEGSPVELSLSEGSLVMRPLRRTRASLKSLLSAVDSSNLNIAPFDDRPRGNETL